jgi:hypothetical protein
MGGKPWRSPPCVTVSAVAPEPLFARSRRIPVAGVDLRGRSSTLFKHSLRCIANERNMFQVHAPAVRCCSGIVSSPTRIRRSGPARAGARANRSADAGPWRRADDLDVGSPRRPLKHSSDSLNKLPKCQVNFRSFIYSSVVHCGVCTWSPCRG